MADGFELAGHERHAGRLAAERLAELRLDQGAGPGELEQEHFLSGVQAERASNAAALARWRRLSRRMAWLSGTRTWFGARAAGRRLAQITIRLQPGLLSAGGV